MPETEVVFFAENDGGCPFLDWLDTLPERVQDKCIVRIERLRELGHQLRRPEADYLRDGIYELRISCRRVQYRPLYFFAGDQAVLSHGCQKEAVTPPKEIDLAVERKSRHEKNPLKHTWGEMQ
jgi:phage-related protein